MKKRREETLEKKAKIDGTRFGDKSQPNQSDIRTTNLLAMPPMQCTMEEDYLNLISQPLQPLKQNSVVPQRKQEDKEVMKQIIKSTVPVKQSREMKK